MQLSKLEIKGFKSFGDKVVINFDQGITGIVGPNGCGKSNVVDSIRWVLGEQKTRNLRSEKMENIIFNGTRNRKAQQLAEVSITFNNTKNLLPTEYSEVTITRRYYRTGDSEYLLNGVTCRLKDITNLFLDTGIGPDSYAIIELKMVDDILNDKDNSRRNLFEEAAGISKFKIRKKETLRKLEDTDADLARVDDLLFEIEKNMKSLEKQAKQTEKYFVIKDEYKKFSILIAGLSIKKFHESLANLKTKVDTEIDRKTVLNKDLATKEAEISKFKADLVNREKLLSSRQKALNEHIAKIRQYESEKKIKNERVRYLNESLTKLHEQIELDKKSHERAEFSVKSLTDELISTEKQFNELEAKLAILKTDYEQEKEGLVVLQERSTVLNNKLKQEEAKVFQFNKTLEISEIQLSTFQQELEKNDNDSNSHVASLSDFESKISLVKTQLDIAQRQVNIFIEAEEKLNADIEAMSAEIDKIKDENVKLNRKLDARQNEFNLTKSLVENLEGFPDAVRFLRKNSQWAKEAPLLSDIVTCDEEFRIPIENYLENYMNYYVVEQEQQALQAVNMLSEASKGKANFFVTSAFDNFMVAEPKDIPHAKRALDLVEYDPRYQKLVEYVLNDVYIVFENQEQIPDTNAVIITQNGKLAKRRFSISGGSVGLFEGKRIGRAKNLEKLEKEIVTLTNKANSIKEVLNDKLNAFQELKNKTYKADIESVKVDLNRLGNDLVSLETRKEQLSSLLSSTAGRKDEILEKMDAIRAEMEAVKPNLAEAKANLNDIELDINDLNKELLLRNETLQQRSNAFNQENIFYHQLKNKLNSTEQEIGYKKTAAESSLQRVLKNTEDLKKVDADIKAMLNNAEVSEDELVELYKEKEAIEGGLSEAEKEYYGNRGQIDLFEKEIKEIQKNREAIDLILVELNNKINEEKISLTAIQERLGVEFEVKLSDLDDEKLQTELSEKEIQHKLNTLKQNMEKIGPINPMAMEAYNEIKQRFTFITDQKADLLNAKKSLMETINEIDVVARQTFLDAFHEIRENFIKVFRSLFSDEDSCDLKLTYPNEPTESPIEIIARPKGKRPLTINQLSGGEKTLTAISLLFSIYLLKPAPFCIFDEVDAPLDDANIDKFNNIIRKFSADSQFIVVTHNKRTMASTDVIYGVTMLEQGVSRVVPVDLRALV